MTKDIKGFVAFLRGEKPRESDFSAFFSSSSADKAKVIRQVLREANEEQKKVMEEYRDRVPA